VNLATDGEMLVVTKQSGLMGIHVYFYCGLWKIYSEKGKFCVDNG